MSYIGEVLKNGINIQEVIKKIREKLSEKEILILHPSPGHSSFLLVFGEPLEVLYQ